MVLLRDPDLLALWDAHDWPGLFWRQRGAWRDGRIELAVFGHALFEHALVPELLLVGKCLAVFDETAGSGESVAAVATAISNGAVLNEPAERRLDVIRALGRFEGQASNCHFTTHGTQAWRT